MTQLQTYLTIALDIIKHDDVVELLREYKYEEEPSVAVLERAFFENEEFVKEFAELAAEAAKTPYAKQRFDHYAGTFNKGTGKKTTNTAGEGTEGTEVVVPGADGRKPAVNSEDGLKWFNAVTSGLSSIISTSGGFLSILNGTSALPTQLSIEEQKRLQEQQQTQRLLIWGGIGLLVFLVVGAVLVKVLKK